MVAQAVERYGELLDLDAIRTALAAKSLRHFVRAAWPIVEPATPYAHNWHIDALCDHLEATLRGEIRNLLITMPPRAMKSLTVSVFFPAWAWIRRPELRFLYASYASQLATEHSQLTRMVVESEWYRARWGDRVQLLDDDNLKTRFSNTALGKRIATSVGASVTGFGGDFVVVDDPHNVQQVESDAIRAAAVRWWNKAMSTRLNDPKTGVRIVVMQRVHETDVAGSVLDQGTYAHLNLPMEYEPTAYVGPNGWRDPRTEPGELLWPARYPAAHVERLKRELGSYDYAAQFQQRPSPAEGGILKRDWWRYYREVPSGLTDHTQSWDMTFRETQAGSFIVGQVWAARGADFYLLDQVRFRGDFPTAQGGILRLSAKWPQAVGKLVENKANGPAIVSSLRGVVDGLIEVEPAGGKLARANAVAPLVEAGNVYLPDPAYAHTHTDAAWVNDLIEEAAAFPSGAHDDQVDCLSQALSRMRASADWWMVGGDA